MTRTASLSNHPPAMDILVSSNLERLLYDVSEKMMQSSRCMTSLKENGL